jgi:hypothetical protein
MYDTIGNEDGDIENWEGIRTKLLDKSLFNYLDSDKLQELVKIHNINIANGKYSEDGEEIKRQLFKDFHKDLRNIPSTKPSLLTLKKDELEKLYIFFGGDKKNLTKKEITNELINSKTFNEFKTNNTKPIFSNKYKKEVIKMNNQPFYSEYDKLLMKEKRKNKDKIAIPPEGIKRLNDDMSDVSYDSDSDDSNKIFSQIKKASAKKAKDLTKKGKKESKSESDDNSDYSDEKDIKKVSEHLKKIMNKIKEKNKKKFPEGIKKLNDDNNSDYSDNDNTNDVYEKYKKNFNKGKGLKVGKGVKNKSIDKFVHIGKYMLHYPKLFENVFNLRYKSGANHKKFPINSISKDYTNFLIDFIERKSVNNKLLNLLPNLEQMHFKNLLRESGLSNEFKVKTNADSEEKNDHERFEILQGEIIAGQNNPKVINEFKDILQKFSQTGKLTKMQVKNAMNVLKNVSK